MPKRTGTIDLMSATALQAFEIGMQSVTSRKAEVLRTRDMLYSNLIQADVERIDFQSDAKSATLPLPTAKPLQKRVRTTRISKTVATAYALAAQVYTAYPRSAGFDDKGFFLICLPTLLHAAHAGTSAILATEIPQISSMRLPSDIRHSLQRLYAQFVFRPVDLPFVHLAVERDAVRRYEDVLCSRLFTDYEEAALELDTSWVPMDKAVTSMRKAANSLVRANNGFLGLRKTPLTIAKPFLSIIAELCDGMSGKLAKAVLALMGGITAEERRVVVYRMLPFRIHDA